MSILNISDREYRELDAINVSRLKAYAKSPKHAKYWWNKNQHKPAFDFGTAFHMACLEPNRFETEVLTFPTFQVKSKTQPLTIKEQKEAWEEINSDKIALKQEDYDTVLFMRDALFLCGEARDLLADTQKEKSLLWEHRDVKLKGRLDFVGSDYFGDLKTCADASERSAQLDAKKFKYFHSMAWYQWGLQETFDKIFTPFIIAIEKTAPYGVGIYEIDQAGVERARHEALEWLDTHLWCERENQWPNYPLGKIYYGA